MAEEQKATAEKIAEAMCKLDKDGIERMELLAQGIALGVQVATERKTAGNA